MTQQQWNAHKDHMEQHIKWPATKGEIIAACAGEDVEPGVMNELKTKLSDSGKKYSEEEVKMMLVH